MRCGKSAAGGRERIARGSFVAALVGPGEFWWDIGFFVLPSFGAAPGGIDSNFAPEARRASQAARFDRVLVVSVSVKSCHHDGDRVAFIVGGQPASWSRTAASSLSFGNRSPSKPLRPSFCRPEQA
jgi:hypothetical protein